MADHLTRTARSELMSRIRSGDTQPELLLRSLLHRQGLRFRTHVRRLPGSPDIVLARHRTAVFVNGCFWHHHSGCKRATYPTTRVGFWRRKIALNIGRDRRAKSALRRMGWKVITVWQCQLSKSNASRHVERIIKQLRRDDVGG